MDIFDKEAAVYDQWYETKLGNYVDEVETECAFGLFAPPPGSRVLEVGCGTGNFSLKLARRGYRVTGVDVSAEMLAVAQEKAKAENLPVEFKYMDAHRLAFEDASFNSVLAMATFEFLADPEQALEEMFRVTRAGSPILVGTINRDSDWGRLYRSPQFEGTVFEHARFLTPEELRRLKADHLVSVRECLFISPDADVEHLDVAQAWQEERSRSEGRKGGFVCALWRT